MSINEFFKQYPEADGVWQAGDQLFFKSAEALARRYAGAYNVELNWVERPQPAPAPKASGKKDVNDGTE
jgi:hypothetical protein